MKSKKIKKVRKAPKCPAAQRKARTRRLSAVAAAKMIAETIARYRSEASEQGVLPGIMPSMMLLPIHKIMIWNTAGGSYQIEGIDEEGSIVCSVAVGSSQEAAQIGLHFSSRVERPCYWLKLSWLASEGGELGYLPSSVKPLRNMIASEGEHALEPVWN
jgi:hypothetical protein